MLPLAKTPSFVKKFGYVKDKRLLSAACLYMLRYQCFEIDD